MQEQNIAGLAMVSILVMLECSSIEVVAIHIAIMHAMKMATATR